MEKANDLAQQVASAPAAITILNVANREVLSAEVIAFSSDSSYKLMGKLIFVGRLPELRKKHNEQYRELINQFSTLAQGEALAEAMEELLEYDWAIYEDIEDGELIVTDYNCTPNGVLTLRRNKI